MNPAPAQQWAADVASPATYATPNEHELEAMGALLTEWSGGDARARKG